MKTYGRVTGMVAVLAAIAMSGTALADHNPNHGTGKEKPKGSPGKVKSKSSIEVENHCVPDEDTKSLTVYSRIWNQSEDDVEITYVEVDGFQLVPEPIDPGEEVKRKKVWTEVGVAKYPKVPTVPFTIVADPEGDDEPVTYKVSISLCTSAPLLDAEAESLNVTTQFMIGKRNFVNNCDDPLLEGDDPDPTDDLIEDTVDQSQIDIEDYPDLRC